MTYLLDILKAIPKKVAEWVMSNTRLVMPIILMLCISATVIIAVNARGRITVDDTEDFEPDLTLEEEQNGVDIEDLIDLPLELNTNPEIASLIADYYQALTTGDSEAAALIRVDLDFLEKIRIEQMTKYVEAYEDVEIYTKPGLKPGTYVIYVCHHIRLHEIDALVPGMMPYYVTPNENGNLTLRFSDLNEEEREYVSILNYQDSVVDLYNRVTVEFNNLRLTDIEADEYIDYMRRKLDEDVGIILAQMQQPDITVDMFRDGMAGMPIDSGDENQDHVSNVTWIARANTVVNIRSSDSETAERIDRAIAGQEFTVLEQKINGWSRIQYQRGEAFIKTEFLDIISEIGGTSSSNVTTIGEVRVTSNSVRVRSTPSTSGDVLGTVYSGSRLNYVERMDNGWTKVVYNDQIGYIRSDLCTVV